MLLCLECGRLLDGKRRKYCSDSCRYRARDRTRGIDYYKAHNGRYHKCSDCDRLTCGITCQECRGSRSGPIRDLELIRVRAEVGGNRNNRGLGSLHQQAVEALRQQHIDGSPCDWCGRPRWLDKTKNWDFTPGAKRSGNGTLQGDHIVARSQFIEADLPIPLPDRLLHGICNIQRGDGRNDHLAWVNRAQLRDSRIEL